MCGIAGLVCLSKNDHIQSIIASMTNSIKHRGPDDEGFVFFKSDISQTAGANDTAKNSWNAPFPYCPSKSIDELNDNYRIAFGHRRLSVIDLSEAGHQPMCNENKNIWITCNGEIYNYIELREELKTKNNQFCSNSDIEVLLKAYQTWGINCLDKLNGMWSFVIYDEQKQILFGSRDRFGVKPMYYTLNDDFFAFASEQKALLCLPNNDFGVNYSAVFEHLYMSKIESKPEGFYKNIFELLPSHYFVFDLKENKLNIKRYYTLQYNNQYERFDQQTFDKYAQEIKEKIHNAIEIRLRSDVNVGFCLSGGIDSSSIISVAQQINKANSLKQLSGQLTAFTAVNNSKEFDESHWAKIVVNDLNIKQHQVYCKPQSILQDLEQMIYHQDIPLFSTSTYAQSKVMQAAKENNITILMDGQGGDELFSGYPVFYSSFYIDLIRHFKINSFFNELGSISNSPTSKSIFFKSLVKIGLDKVISNRMASIIAKSFKQESQFFNTAFLNENRHLMSLSNEYSAKPMNELLHQYCTGYYLKHLLRWEDRCSMQYSIESRTPFADDLPLIELLFSIPANYKIHNGWSKLLLRESLKGIIPEPIRTRKDKLGFSTPQYQWLKEINAAIKINIKELAIYDDYKIVNTEKMFKNWDAIFSNSHSAKSADFIWRYLNFLLWKKTFFNK
ncbi:MAG: asparagine synthase (glutamine-hydrolyzing) [Bacteroidetes bacterium CG2_30_32_10]|nr:MAG: asparagine synthase (glutamine-hydrolyzing) [Bacteroidetes bacterium CG2_30_32_10]